MSLRHLDVNDHDLVADFISENEDYLPKTDRQPYAELLERLEEGERVPFEEMVPLVRTLAAAVWVPRRALHTYLDHEGAEVEWQVLFETVRPATALLLNKLRESTGARTVDAALQSGDAAIAIHDQQEVEISLLRPELHLKIWQEHVADLQPFLANAEAEFQDVRFRLHHLRKLFERTADQALRDKLETFEDRILFGGEMIPLEILDKEIAFDRSDAEVPPDEGLMM